MGAFQLVLLTLLDLHGTSVTRGLLPNSLSTTPRKKSTMMVAH